MYIAHLRSSIYCIPISAFLLLSCWYLPSRGDDVIFADDFEAGLSSQWNVSGISRDDYRIRDGGLELRVHPGRLSDDTPMLTVALPIRATDVLVASVEVTILDRFTEPSELAGLFLTAEGKVEFGAKKQYVDGHLLFSPGQPEFIGQPGEEGDSDKYAMRYWPATQESGPLRIIVRNEFAFFQVGPTAKGDYLNFFHSAIEKSRKQRGFALVAAGGPDRGAHWVRFDNFRVLRVKWTRRAAAAALRPPTPLRPSVSPRAGKGAQIVWGASASHHEMFACLPVGRWPRARRCIRCWTIWSSGYTNCRRRLPDDPLERTAMTAVRELDYDARKLQRIHKDPLLIAVAGHANHGKTSVVRTLCRMPEFGEVRDFPGTTREISGVPFKIVGQTYMIVFDTPGFQHSTQAIEACGERFNIHAIRQYFERNSACVDDLVALDQVLRSDVVLYVIDSACEPTESLQSDFRVLARSGIPVIPLFNSVKGTPSAEQAAWEEFLHYNNYHLDVH